MTICPYCRSENLAGADVCDQCQQPLHELSLAPPESDVERYLLEDRIASLDPREPLVVAPSTPLAQVLHSLVEHSVGCVVVVEEGRVTGIFSERDALMRAGAEAARLADRPVSELMTPNPEMLRADAKIAFAVRLMDEGHYRHVPVIDQQGRLVGIISVRDILRYLTVKMNE